jgi:outer membrane protein assembly factor BamB
VTRIHRVVGCVALVVALAGCWPQPGQGPDRTAYNPHETTLTPATVGGMRRLWSVEPGRIVGSPVMSPAGVHVAAFDDMGGLDLLTYGANGAARWSRRVTPDAVPYVHASSGAWVVGDRVGAGYYVYDDGFGNWADAPSFDVATGAPLGPLGDGPVVAVRGDRVVSTFRRSISPTGQEAGARLRDLNTGEATTVALTDGGGFTLGAGRLYNANLAWVSAWDPAPSGGPQELWVTSLPGATTEPVLNADGSVLYVVANVVEAHRGRLFALDAATGATLWSSDLGSPGTMPALADGVLYVQTALGWLIALPAGGCGAVECPSLWEAAGGHGAAATTQPAVAGDVVYTGWGDGSIVAHDRAGTRLWSGSAGSEAVAAGPVVSVGQVYVTTADGGLTAFGL